MTSTALFGWLKKRFQISKSKLTQACISLHKKQSRLRLKIRLNAWDERGTCNDLKCKALCDNDQVCLTMFVVSGCFNLTCCDLDRVVSTQDSTK